VILQYGYVVCRSVLKPNTVPIPALPILENPWVFPYPCRSLVVLVVVVTRWWWWWLAVMTALYWW
jgi:hypothetical protein